MQFDEFFFCYKDITRKAFFTMTTLLMPLLENVFLVKFVFSKKATKFDKIFTVDLTLTTYCQIDGEDFVNFCGLLKKHKLYKAIGANATSSVTMYTGKCISPCLEIL